MKGEKAFNSVQFSKTDNAEFYKVLRRRVNEYFKKGNISRHANGSMVFKTICMMSLYLTPFILILVLNLNAWWYLLLWFVMGVGMAGVGLSVMHDANHGAYSKNPLVNNIIGKVLVLLGGNDTNWRIQHNVLHHTYTNISNLDEDIAPPSFILRFSPHTKRTKIHRFQHIYAYFFYGLMTMMWFLSKDYVQARRYKEMDLVKTQGLTYRRHVLNIIVSKVIYGFITIIKNTNN
mgnify:FL=1